MNSLWDLNLIHLLNFYLVMLFIASVVRRIDLYRSVLGLVRRVPGRWPRLFDLVKEHRLVFFTWPTLLPALLALALTVAQLFASYQVWPEAGRPPDGLTVGRLAEFWPTAFVVLSLGLAMLGVDIYGIVVIGQIDRKLLEKYFDQAEYWLRSRTAHVVRFFTFGYINPRRMVAIEVQKALVEVSKQLNTSLWWIVLQVGLRITFCLSLWLSWAALHYFHA
jgi:hypothetical protein